MKSRIAMINRMKIIVILLLAFLALPALADPPCDVHTITVTGNGSAKVVPDRVSFTVGVFTNSASVREAFKGNNEKTHRVVEALKQRGVKDTEIQTSNFSIGSAYDEMARKKNGFNVTNSVTVTREDPKSAGDLIAVAVEAGANEASGVTFFNSDPTSTRDRAIERAVKDARLQAEKLAAATGSTLGRATMISTALSGADMSNVNGWMRLNTVEGVNMTGSAPAIETGTSTISYNVTITYELR
jgi:uncharacterized protein YggE